MIALIILFIGIFGVGIAIAFMVLMAQGKAKKQARQWLETKTRPSNKELNKVLKMLSVKPDAEASALAQKLTELRGN